MLSETFTGDSVRIVRILELVKRLQEIESAIGTIRYNQDLVTEVPDVLKTLGAAKDAVIAELKTV